MTNDATESTQVVDDSSGPESDSPPPRKKRTVRSVIGNVLFNIAAVAGVVCLILVLVAVLFNYSFIMFKTGSMSPTIPQGSLALVREVPASDIEVGDIVTVDRPGELPVTHRVIEIFPQTGGEVLIRMQGDANPNPDGGMYRVSTVKETIWHVPGLARWVVWLSDPRVLALLTITATGLVLWAFWPRKREIEAKNQPDEDVNDGEPDDGDTEVFANSEQDAYPEEQDYTGRYEYPEPGDLDPPTGPVR